MRATQIVLFAAILTLGLYSCKDSDECENLPATERTIEILTLGDSRVEGATPDFESYR